MNNRIHPLPHGLLFVIAAPSGAGKTSLVKALRERNPQLTVSISHTTREMRPGEISGENYHFVDDAAFQSMVDQGEFIEHAEVFGHRYGTAQKALFEPIQSGLDLIMEIDWQGARQVKALFKKVCTIFILPPSLASLKERLTKRGQDSEETIAHRMSNAKDEISHCKEFDYLVVNADFSLALSELETIIKAEHLRYRQQAERHQSLLALLLSH